MNITFSCIINLQLLSQPNVLVYIIVDIRALYRMYHDISVVSILWLYDTYHIIHFSYTILQMIQFCLNLGYFGH